MIFKRLPVVTPWLHIWIPPAPWEETWLHLKTWTYDMNQGLLSIFSHLRLQLLYYIGCSTLLEIRDSPENKQLWGCSCPYQENCLKPAQKAKCFLTCDQSHPGSWRHGLLSDLHAVLVVVQSLSRVRLFVTPWTAARQASLSITNSWSLLKLMSIESVMPYNHLILCHPLLLPAIFPSIRVFSNGSALHIR